MKRLMGAFLAAVALMPTAGGAQEVQAEVGRGRPDGARDRGDTRYARPERPASVQAAPRGDDRYFRAAEQAGRRDRDDRRDGRDWRQDRAEDRAGWTGRRGDEGWRSDRNDRRRGERDRDDRRQWDDRRDRGVGVGVIGGGWNDGRRVDDGRYGRDSWNRGWRDDRRYDWNGWRDRNRQAYRLPRYYGPSGWNGGYRRFGVGVRLSGLLFAQDYWIGDPGYYRLPPVRGPYRWVRYYNDALLVDVRYGTVVDTVYDIFW